MRPDDFRMKNGGFLATMANISDVQFQMPLTGNQADFRRTGEKKLRKLSEQLPTHNNSNSISHLNRQTTNFNHTVASVDSRNPVVL